MMMLGFLDLNKDILSYLKEMESRKDNFANFTYSESIISLKYLNTKHHYVNDLEFLKKIDTSLPFPTPYKLLFYTLYNSYLLTYDELYGFINFLYKENKYKFFDSYTIEKYLIEEMFIFKYGEMSRIFCSRGVLPFESFIFRSFDRETPRVDFMEKLYLLNNFLINSDDDGTFEQYYSTHLKKSVYKDDGTIDLTMFKNSPYISNLIDNFSTDTAGSMTNNVKKSTIKKLEKLSKEEYLNVLRFNSNSCKKPEELDIILEIISNKENDKKDKKFPENIDSLVKVFISKIISNDEISILNLFSFLRNIFNESIIDQGKNIFVNNLSTKIAEIIVKEKENLTHLQILILSLALVEENFWVRTGDRIDALIILLELLEKDTIGTARILEYIVFYYDKQPPTVTQWKNITKEIVSIVPAVALDLINDTDRKRYYTLADTIKQWYKNELI